MVLWKNELDHYIQKLDPPSPSILPIVFKPPNTVPSIHCSVYLPTCGLDSQFLEELANLSATIDQLKSRYPGSALYLRGDFNVSSKNLVRTALLDSFKNVEGLAEVPILHPTYHHFMGNGLSDSNLDRLLVNHDYFSSEVLDEVLCRNENPLIELDLDFRVLPC